MKSARLSLESRCRTGKFNNKLLTNTTSPQSCEWEVGDSTRCRFRRGMADSGIRIIPGCGGGWRIPERHRARSQYSAIPLRNLLRAESPHSPLSEKLWRSSVNQQLVVNSSLVGHFLAPARLSK